MFSGAPAPAPAPAPGSAPAQAPAPAGAVPPQRWPHSRFHDLHVWGCPTYVLDKKIADGNKLPRWKPRSHHAVYMGMSPTHASSVPLLLNPDTGYITANFHVVFDDWFSTVSSSHDPGDSPVDISQSPWSDLFRDSVYQYVFDDDEKRLSRRLGDIFVSMPTAFAWIWYSTAQDQLSVHFSCCFKGAMFTSF